MWTKKIKLLVILSLACLSGAAQVRWGVEAGVNVSHGFETSKTMTGFNVGATTSYDFNSRWMAEAALKIGSQPCGDKYIGGYANPSLQTKSDRTIHDTEYKPYYLTLPIRIGYRLQLTKDIDLLIGAGPTIGLGLFGKGTVRDIPQSETPTPITTYKSNNLFNSNSEVLFSASRFEYGANAKIAFELSRHYDIGINYSLMHITGDKAAIDNVGILSIDIGYRF